MTKNKSSMKKIAIIGAGGWGTALSIVLSQSSVAHRIALWAREEDVRESLRKERKNPVFLPGFAIPEQVEVASAIPEAVQDADFIIGAMPSAHARALYSQILSHASPRAVVVSATKGLEPKSYLRMTQVIADLLPPKSRHPIAAISGPSFAKEVAQGDPTAIVVASANSPAAREIQQEFSGPALRLYTNADVTGVEIGGAVKNVIAIAAGVAEGLGLGHNTIAALITRGLAEIMRLGTALGARRETLAGLAGLGDLVLTCTGELSRNRRVGIELGHGKRLDEILASTSTVAEGVGTTAAALALARKAKIEMPIAAQMHGLLYQGRSPHDAIRELMHRPLKAE
ncbi:MAG TPA: NAD(P)H-dependent glycerol-3-phosphate dehydrogenase [Candidatus Acidoferrales bacterium]|nr:NAD(P)H-dependent glycerol-3-phosphate dehydrogenase [Candidatus Acidoferrales bacterium]